MLKQKQNMLMWLPCHRHLDHRCEWKSFSWKRLPMQTWLNMSVWIVVSKVDEYEHEHDCWLQSRVATYVWQKTGHFGNPINIFAYKQWPGCQCPGRIFFSPGQTTKNPDNQVKLGQVATLLQSGQRCVVTVSKASIDWMDKDGVSNQSACFCEALFLSHHPHQIRLGERSSSDLTSCGLVCVGLLHTDAVLANWIKIAEGERERAPNLHW